MRRIALALTGLLLTACGLGNFFGGGGGGQAPGGGVVPALTIVNDTTFPAGTYEIEGMLYVRGATLTLEPGAVLRFPTGGGIYLEPGGRLVAQGESDSTRHVVFTASDSGWAGIFVSRQSDGIQLSWCDIESGGLGQEAALVLEKGGARITHTRIDTSWSWGVYIARGAAPETFSDNTITRGAQGPVYVEDPNDLASLGLGDYTGNAYDAIVVGGGRLTRSARWSAPGVPYVFEGSLEIGDWDNTPVLEIADSASLAFPPYEGLFVGRFRPGGLQARAVTFMATDPENPWLGIEIGEEAQRVVLEECAVMDGGANGFGNLYLHGATQVRVRNSWIAYSASYGVYLAADATFLEFQGNTVTGSALAPLYLESPEALGQIGSGDYTGNAQDLIVLGGGDLTQSAIWRNLGVPVALEGSLSLSDGAILTLDRGLVILFDTGTSLSVGHDGPAALVADSVTFGALTPGGAGIGGWNGIKIGPEATPATAFTNCLVENGGDDGFGNFHLTDRPWITITGCTIRASAAYGIYLEGTSDDPDYRNFLLQNNTFEVNALGDIGPGS